MGIFGAICQNKTCNYDGDGTSMAAPIFAAVVRLRLYAHVASRASLMSNRSTASTKRRLASGKSVVGFINPALYAHPHVLNDVYGGR